MLLSELAWKVSIYLFRSENEVKWWSLVPQRVPTNIMEKLSESGLRLFSHPHFAHADNIRQKVSELFSLVSHIRDFINLPTEPKDNNNGLQNYVDQVVPKINEDIQIVLDSISTLSRELQSEGNFPDIQPLINELRKHIRPDNDHGYKISLTLKLDDLNLWVEKLSQANLDALALYLQLASYLTIRENLAK